MSLTLNQKLLVLGKLYDQCRKELVSNYIKMGYSGAYAQQLATEQCDLFTKGGAKNKVITAQPPSNKNHTNPQSVSAPFQKK